MNVLLTSVGRRAYLVEYFKRELHPLGGRVFAVNTHPDATGYLAADERAIVPASSDPAYVGKLIGLCRKWDVRLLFSLHDWDAPVIARARERFLEIGTIPVMGDASVLAACLDKLETVRVAGALGVRTPRTVLTLDEAEELKFPLIVKPRWGQGSLGLFKVEDRKTLEWAYRLSDAVAGRFSAICPEIRGDQPQVLIQENAFGQECGCDIVNDLEGRFRRAFVKRKFAMRSGETDAAESADVPSVSAAAEKIAVWSRHLGCMDSDWIVGADGEPTLIELNPRFGGGYPFTHGAGANVVKACVNWARGIDNDLWCRDFRAGIRMFKDISLVVMKGS